MAKVNFYSAEVKYSGALEDYTLKHLTVMAQHKIDQGQDCWDETLEMTDDEAKEWDGKSWIENKYPCNKLVIIGWSYIDDWTDDEDDEEE